MSKHYNAFISYKHEKKDTMVAEAIHRGLERYSIPAKIKKSTGVKRIERIFRDKDELPLTNDLSETIQDALRNSDFLIVICSSKTKESIWVEREIKFFLQTHTKKQVLTVLVDGEPNDVIPPILLRDDKLVYDSYGNQKVVSVDVEPLSCDYRLPVRQAKKVELPRLVSALIGCSYDDLMNRHRQYLVRRTALIFSLGLVISLVFGAYMYRSRSLVQASYINSLRNQSRYLANESLNLLAEEDRLTAIKLALASLPKDENDPRPIIPESINALTKASYAYVMQASTNIGANCVYSHSGIVQKFVLSPNGRYLATIDNNANISGWDTNEQTNIFSKKLDTTSMNEIFFSTDNKFIYSSMDSIYCFDPAKKAELWSYRLQDDFFQNNGVFCESDEFLFGVTNSHKMLKISLKDGSVLETYEVPEIYPGKSVDEKEETSKDKTSKDKSSKKSSKDIFDIEVPEIPDFSSMTDAFSLDDLPSDTDEDSDGPETLMISRFKISPDQNKIAFLAYVGRNELAGCIDLTTGNTVYSEPRNTFLSDFSWADNDHLLIANTSDVFDTSTSIGNVKILKQDQKIIECYNPNDMSIIWNETITINEAVQQSEFLNVESMNAVSYYSGNVFAVYDINTGKVLMQGNVNDSIIYSYINKNSKQPIYISKGGYMCIPGDSAENGTVYLTKFFSDRLDSAEVVGTLFCVHPQGSNDIISYTNDIYDKNWVQIDKYSGIDVNNIRYYYMDENVLSYIISGEQPELVVYDITGDEYKHRTFKLNKNITTDENILGSKDNKLYFQYSDADKNFLFCYDLTNDNTVEKELPSKYVNALSDVSANGKFSYTGTDEKYNDVLYVYDTNDFTVKDYLLKEPEDSKDQITYYHYSEINTESNTAFLSGSVNQIVNLETGDITEVKLPDSAGNVIQVKSLAEKQMYAVVTSKSIFLVDCTGKIVDVLSDNTNEAYRVTYYTTSSGQNILLILCSNNILMRYDLDAKKYTGATELSTSKDAMGTPTVRFDEKEHTMYVQINSSISVIDSDNWVELFSIDRCFGYQEKTDRFLVIGAVTPEEFYLGYFKHYSIDELMENARNIINNSDLTDEQKFKYGIEDE